MGMRRRGRYEALRILIETSVKGGSRGTGQEVVPDGAEAVEVGPGSHVLQRGHSLGGDVEDVPRIMLDEGGRRGSAIP
jgi:hypothetical protein